MEGSRDKQAIRRTPVRVAVGLGANLGDRLANLCLGIRALRQLPDCAALQLSAIYETGPIDCAEPWSFLNAVAAFETRLAPVALLQRLLAIEQRLGRRRPYPNAPRALDLDLLLYGDERIEKEGLTIPHPRLQDRLFVLTPLREIWSAEELPGLGASAAKLEANRKSRGRAEDVILKSQTQWPTELLG